MMNVKGSGKAKKEQPRNKMKKKRTDDVMAL
jgi:hypothetical protein